MNMSGNRQSQTAVRLVVAAMLVLGLAACTGTRPPADGGASPTGPGPSPTTTRPEPSPGGRGGGHEIDPCAGPTQATGWLLRELRSAAHPDHDRVVVELCGGGERTVVVEYVDRVVQNPTGEPVPLTGGAFLVVSISPATLDTTQLVGPSQAHRYTGPQRWSVGYPLVKEIAVAGDFESTLSFGLGLARPAVVTVLQLTDPPRVAVDLWYAVPQRPLWPVRTIDQARDLQQAVDQGHQPWLLSPEQVVTFYLEQEQGWRGPSVRRLSDNLYAASGSDGGNALVAVVQPVRSGAGGVWLVTWFRSTETPVSAAG